MTPVFLPQPHKVTLGKGRFVIPPSGTIGICGWRLYPAAEQARKLFKRYSIAVAARGVGDPVRIRRNEKLRPGGYRLKIDPDGVLLEAKSVAAASWGLQTLFQAAKQSPAGTLPILTIDDWPDFQDRGVYYDVARGRVPKTERLLDMAETLAHYKINQLQLYVEHTFRFRGHPDIGTGASPMTAEDTLRLDACCRENHVELIPSLASFGHLATVLKHPRYRHLAEDWGVGKYLDPEAHKHRILRAWSLSPANPKIYEFLDSLWAEYLPLFRSDRFNVCCDETWDLGLGQSYELCKRRGRGRVYLDHIRRLRDLAARHGKRILFWGDIIRQHPDLIPRIPKDVTVLDWGYSFDQDFAAIRDFRKAGLEFYACPGTSSWMSLFPRLPESAANIAGFAAAGKRNGAAGLLNTDWGDGGHGNFMEYSWWGYLFGAEQAWNVAADQKSFTSRFCKLFLNIEDRSFARAVDELGEISHLRFGRFYQSIWQHVLFAAPGDAVLNQGEDAANVCRNGKIFYTRMKLDAKVGAGALRRIEPVRQAIADKLADRAGDPHGILPYWLFAADTIRHAAGKLSLLGPGGSAAPADRRRLRREMTSLRKRFETLWHERNRPSEIRITLKRYDRALRAL